MSAENKGFEVLKMPADLKLVDGLIRDASHRLSDTGCNSGEWAVETTAADRSATNPDLLPHMRINDGDHNWSVTRVQRKLNEDGGLKATFMTSYQREESGVTMREGCISFGSKIGFISNSECTKAAGGVAIESAFRFIMRQFFDLEVRLISREEAFNDYLENMRQQLVSKGKLDEPLVSARQERALRRGTLPAQIVEKVYFGVVPKIDKKT